MKKTQEEIRQMADDYAFLALTAFNGTEEEYHKEWSNITQIYIAIYTACQENNKAVDVKAIHDEYYMRVGRGDFQNETDLLDVDAAWSFFLPHLKPAESELVDDDVEWIVNDNAELGVKIGSRMFFLYKGCSLEYKDGLHDDGRPMKWRPVYKREFGECCHPPHLNRIPDDYSQESPGDWTEFKNQQP